MSKRMSNTTIGEHVRFTLNGKEVHGIIADVYKDGRTNMAKVKVGYDLPAHYRIKLKDLRT